MAHLMAQAITHQFPNEHIEFGVGPVIDHGFYYDVEMDHRLNEADLKNIEKKMKELIKKKLPIERKVMKRDEAIKHFEDINQKLKVELISDIPADEEISFFTQGDFIDLCRGPHVENTNNLPFSFKLTHVAGAYWRGSEKNQMLQRVYAVCFSSKEELQDHLKMLEEAKRRDHRKLGKELELFHFEPVAPASPFFMPKGAFIYNELVSFMRRIYDQFGYSEVITPQILDSDLWHTSGHYAHYKENMYFSNIDDREYAVKPMNCPCHMLMFKHYKYSYRDLPLRYADFGRLHRYEKAGAVAGLTRVRTFCQDDAHIFIPMDKIQGEIQDLMRMFFICYEHFGFTGIKVNLSTRPEDKAGDDATWDIAEGALKDALDASGHAYHIKEGDGAFYGPKIDVEIADALGRYFQLGTIQLDFQLPDRFDLTFTNQDGKEERPVVIHRALLGSLERFIGVYIEHVGAAFPFWIAPEQAIIVPVNNETHEAAASVLAGELRSLGLRIRVDNRNETMGYKTRQIQKSKVPYMIVIGDREIETQSVSLRAYGSRDSETLTNADVKKLFTELNQERVPKELR
ncbi:MAG: threonine--tRNA ligase [Bdellovibrionales bacterium CG12_big_fil_rev_8_21_14_0_65_38_15]|nr:MAG: threonine--tRNA ligase [Bdellovibrionales bacterium CG22_combo_CG10-13_8_21_14_all_38_13]PIQ57055.1 MAG: threonine--tRNA ligase [Bdellovibrionales bacterium CG12_big_fil_rev_8_21_14_0_65_38_15]PIR29108.1 MAG: threonine--tRNA ligase [Bdellovibrionales bacterium CG11_big_fil_rev_8_21_14_0_20_38_13]